MIFSVLVFIEIIIMCLNILAKCFIPNQFFYLFHHGNCICLIDLATCQISMNSLLSLIYLKDIVGEMVLFSVFYCCMGIYFILQIMGGFMYTINNN